MRLPRPRLRLRTLLIAVAVAGLALGGWQMWKRRESCLAEAVRLEISRDELSERLKHSESWAAEEHDRLAQFRAARETEIEHGESGESAELKLQILDLRIQVQQDKAEEYQRQARDLRGDIEIQVRAARRYRHVARYLWLPMPRQSD